MSADRLDGAVLLVRSSSFLMCFPVGDGQFFVRPPLGTDRIVRPPLKMPRVPSVHFLCPRCEVRLARIAGETVRPCESCDEASSVTAPPPDTLIDHCAACRHDQPYFQKDFNRTTGVSRVAIGAILAPFTYFISLGLVTVLDYVIWRKIRNVISCAC